jgi:hypothetical protein
MRKLSTGLVVALLGGAFLVGCGSSSKSTSTSTSSTNAGATGAKSGAARQLSPAQRVEVCQRIVRAPSNLPASTKANLLKICERVGTSTTAQHEVAREACVALALQQPAGAVRERALHICRRAP